jgi:hypothetical protein
MVQVHDFYPVKRTITREYAEDGHLLRETIQEFDTEPRKAPEGSVSPWEECRPIKVTCNA